MTGWRSVRGTVAWWLPPIFIACAGATEPDPDPSRFYDLVSIGGEELPVVLPGNGDTVIEVVSATLRLDSEAECVSEVHFRRDGADASWSSLCGWTRQSSTYQFLWEDTSVARADRADSEFTVEMTFASGCPIIGNANCAGPGWTYRFRGT